MIPPNHPLQLALGLTVWLLWFSIAYGALSIACTLAPPSPESGARTWINGLLLIFTLAIMVLLLGWARRCWRSIRQGGEGGSSPRALVAYVATGVHITAAVATLGVGITAAFLPPCL